MRERGIKREGGDDVESAAVPTADLWSRGLCPPPSLGGDSPGSLHRITSGSGIGIRRRESMDKIGFREDNESVGRT